MNTVHENILRLKKICDTFPHECSRLSEKEFCYKSAPEKWSKKEILGHLIDSATNNHQRFIRSQFEQVPNIKYDQNNWNKYNGYAETDTKHLIRFWEIYNRHLIEVMKTMPSENYTKECFTGAEANRTLEWLFDDYINHMNHHIKQIVV